MSEDSEAWWPTKNKRAAQGLARLQAEIEAADRGVRPAADDTGTLPVTISLRLTHELGQQLRQRANAKGLAVSELVRRILSAELRADLSAEPPESDDVGDARLTAHDVEEIARRVVQEELDERQRP